MIDRFTEVIGFDRFAVYVFDYGAPTGFRLAVRHPERISLSGGRLSRSPIFALRVISRQRTISVTFGAKRIHFRGEADMEPA
jgi:hypothetical protein